VEATSAAGAPAAFTATATDQVDGAVPVACTPPSGSTFALGATTVNCSATDAAGNTAAGSFTVTVADTVAPAVTAPASISVAATEAGGARGNVPSSASSAAIGAFLAGGSAADAGDAAPVRLAPQATIGGTVVDVDVSTLFPVGATDVTFRFRDGSGNVGTAVTTVTVAASVGGVVEMPGVPVTGTSSAGVPQPVTVSFAGVTQAGLLTADVIPAPAPAPGGFTFGGQVWDVKTTALVTPPITVCVQGSGFTAADRMLHFEGGAWTDVTTLNSPTEVCGVVTSLSPLAMAEAHPPTADAGPAQTVEATSAAGASVTLLGSGVDPNSNDVLSFRWTEGAVELGTSASLTLTLPIGSHTLVLTVTDSLGSSAMDSTTVTVEDTTAPATVLTAPADGSTVAGTVTVAATASDAVGVAQVEFYAAGVLIGTDASSPYSVAWTAQGGTVTLTARAFDAAGNSSEDSVQVTVAATGEGGKQKRPEITTDKPEKSLDAGRSWTYQLRAKGSNPLVWSLDRAPAGMTIDAATGLLAWTPGVADLGPNNVQVRVTNGAGSDRLVFNLKVEDGTAPTAPTALTATLDGKRALLTWSPSTDNVGVEFYRVYRLKGSNKWEQVEEHVIGLSASVKLEDSGTFTFAVTAVDGAGNESPRSDPASVTVPSGKSGGK